MVVLLASRDGRIGAKRRNAESAPSNEKLVEFAIAGKLETLGTGLMPKLFGRHLASITAAAAGTVLGRHTDCDCGDISDPGIFTASIDAQEESLTAIFDAGKFARAAIGIDIDSSFQKNSAADFVGRGIELNGFTGWKIDNICLAGVDDCRQNFAGKEKHQTVHDFAQMKDAVTGRYPIRYHQMYILSRALIEPKLKIPAVKLIF